jgi:hypothetical protein
MNKNDRYNHKKYVHTLCTVIMWLSVPKIDTLLQIVWLYDSVIYL